MGRRRRYRRWRRVKLGEHSKIHVLIQLRQSRQCCSWVIIVLLRGAVRSLGVRCHDEFGRCFGSYLRYSRLVSFSYQLPITRLALRLCYLQYYASCSQVAGSRFGWLKFEVSMSFSAKLHSAIFWLYRKDLCIVFRSLSVISSACMVQVWNLAPKLRRYHCFILLL